MHAQFAPKLIAWQRLHGRHDLPWQGSREPYSVWLSEIMLQQTQVETVIPYYLRFLARFPDLPSLAAAPLDDVMAHWSGLGYYSRARNLHAAACHIVSRHGGRFPHDLATIQALPGIGRSTAAAISVFAFGARHAILDGNVKRVLARAFAVEGWPGTPTVERQLWALAVALLPDTDIRAYTQGLMDLGATLCTRSKPRCEACPFSEDCLANREGRQAELPTARPRKRLPEKSTTMLLLRHGSEILVEKRPSPGIWGGLWSLPECSPGLDPFQAAAALGHHAASAEPCPELVHVFTHFRLRIQPWLLHVARPLTAEQPGRLWLALEDVQRAALPTPVRRLLSSLLNN